MFGEPISNRSDFDRPLTLAACGKAQLELEKDVGSHRGRCLVRAVAAHSGVVAKMEGAAERVVV